MKQLIRVTIWDGSSMKMRSPAHAAHAPSSDWPGQVGDEIMVISSIRHQFKHPDLSFEAPKIHRPKVLDYWMAT